MKNLLKRIALSLSLLISFSSTTIFADTHVNKVLGNETRLFSTIPTIDGIEDIVSQDTIWRYGVSQPTSFGIMSGIISAALGVSGVAAFGSNSAKNYLVGLLASFTLDNVFKTHNIVNIRFDRYYVRGADKKIRYKVYATYYELDGSVITSRICQSGIVQ